MKRVFIAASLIAVMALPAFGQATTTASLTGRVTDDAGNAIQGATVGVRQKEIGLERSATSSANGEFSFSLLPTGPYVVTVTAEGRQPEVYNVQLGIGQTVPLNVALASGGTVTEAITVTASATALETAEIGDNFPSEQIEQLPVVRRQLEQIATLSPNISFGPTSGDLSIAGAPAFDTRVLLDGAEISDPYFGSGTVVYLEDAIDEVQVMTSGVSARYGRFQGGVINAITKSGTNTFEGTLRTEFESQSWNEQTPYGEAQTDDVQKTYQATLGGPIVQDRLWFFGGLRTIPETSASTNAVYTGEAIPSTRNEERWQVKLRGALTPSHMLDFSYLDYSSEVGNYVGLTPGEALAVGARSDPRTSKTLSYQGVLTPEVFIEAQATQKNVKIMSGGDPEKGDPFIEYRTVTVFNNGWWDFEDASVRDNETLSASLSYAPGTAWFGDSQTFELGVQRVASITGGENRQSPTGLNFVSYNTSVPFYAGLVNGEPRYNVINEEEERWTALPLGGDQTLTNTAIYVQAKQDFQKLRLDLGLRYEAYDGEGPNPQYSLDSSGFAPRVAATYSITPDWQIQGSYGRYVSRLNDNVANSVTGVSNGPGIFHFYTGPTILGATAAQMQAMLRDDSQWGIVSGYTGTDQPTVFQSADIEAPYADDINLSIRHALPRNSGSVVLSYIHRDYKQLLDDFVGEVCGYDFEFDLACPGGNTRIITDPGSGEALALVDNTVWANDPRASREYRALTVVWDYRPSIKWQIAGNYTFGNTKGNYEGEGQNTPSSGSRFGNYERSVDMTAATPFGYADDDIRHRMNLLGSYRLDFGRGGQLSLGSVLLYQSGLPYSLTAAVPLASVAEYANETGSYVYYFGENGEADQHDRGSRRFNDWWQLDFSARYDFPIYRSIRPFAKLSVRNLMGNDEVVKFQTTGRAVRDAAGNITNWAPQGNCGLDDGPSKDCTSFGRIRNQNDYQLPRSYHVALGLTF